MQNAFVALARYRDNMERTHRFQSELPKAIAMMMSALGQKQTCAAHKPVPIANGQRHWFALKTARSRKVTLGMIFQGVMHLVGRLSCEV